MAELYCFGCFGADFGFDFGVGFDFGGSFGEGIGEGLNEALRDNFCFDVELVSNASVTNLILEITFIKRIPSMIKD